MSDPPPSTETAEPAAAAETAEATPEPEQPTTAIVVLGEAMIFKPQADVISITLLYKDQFKDALDQMAKPYSLEVMHVVVKSKDIDTLYDGEAIPNFMPCLKAGADFQVHVIVGENETIDEDAVGSVRMSLVMGGLRLVSDGIDGGGEDSSRVLLAKKPGGEEEEEEESSSSDEE